MSHGTYIAFFALVAFAAIPESTGNCIKKYGHSCLGGHGKRTQLSILPPYAIISGADQPGYIREKYPHSKIASKRRIITSLPNRHSDQEYKSDVRFPENKISPGEIDNEFTDNRGIGTGFFVGNGLDHFKESITADNTFADQGYRSEQLEKNVLFEKFLLNLVNLKRRHYNSVEDEVDPY